MPPQTEISEFVRAHYLANIVRLGGPEAIEATKRVMALLRDVYRVRSCVGLDGVIVLSGVPAWGPMEPLPAHTTRTSVETLGHAIGPNHLLWITDDGHYAYCAHDGAVDLAAVSRAAIVYSRRRGSETFHVRGTEVNVTRSPSLDSAFEYPAFKELRTALEHYGIHLCRDSTCKILQNIWHDTQRALLANKPEHWMRDSLEQFLRCHLRNWRDIMPEQNVDETKPVDIKVTWNELWRIALIEIKWMGDSVGDDGYISTKYRDARAREGAEQLADYLERQRSRSGVNEHRGYLVVFDARRGSSDALKYEHKEITYNPSYHQARTDFEEPVRLYLRPI